MIICQLTVFIGTTTSKINDLAVKKIKLGVLGNILNYGDIYVIFYPLFDPLRKIKSPKLYCASSRHHYSYFKDNLNIVHIVRRVLGRRVFSCIKRNFCNVKPKFQNLIKQEQNMFNHIPKVEWLMHNVITLWELGLSILQNALASMNLT